MRLMESYYHKHTYILQKMDDGSASPVDPVTILGCPEHRQNYYDPALGDISTQSLRRWSKRQQLEVKRPSTELEEGRHGVSERGTARRGGAGRGTTEPQKGVRGGQRSGSGREERPPWGGRHRGPRKAIGSRWRGLRSALRGRGLPVRLGSRRGIDEPSGTRPPMRISSTPPGIAPPAESQEEATFPVNESPRNIQASGRSARRGSLGRDPVRGVPHRRSVQGSVAFGSTVQLPCSWDEGID